MPSLFSPCRGTVVRVQLCDDTDKVFNVKVKNTDLTAKFPVTGYTLEMSGNYQFLHALDGFVYFHSFGDRIGELSLSGVSILTPPCAGGGAAAATGSLQDIYEFYESNKQSVAQKAVEITSGDKITLWGFLTGMRLEVNSSMGVPMGQWALRFHVLPPRK